ncbi:MAG: site-2 protease family protein [Thermoplasmataceae archaeon]|jgi:membrane-associated protease RseP (regulator of RpoE activity)|nr:site-2 protease family protein [Candidatus Thermoplasmatota archaeon]
MPNPILIVLLILIIWGLILVIAAPFIRKSKHFSFMGPAIMVKAVKNRKIMDKVSSRFPGIAFSRISVVLVIISSVVAMVFLAYGSYLATVVRNVSPPSLLLYLVLPGINPAIPIVFGTVSLIAAVVIHEFFHGIVAKKHNITVKSVGALFFIVPIGAFVEPDEKEVTDADPVIRRRIFASGPGINIVIAIFALLILLFVLAPVATPIHSGLYVESVQANSSYSSIPDQSEITSIGNYSGTQLYSIMENSTLIPGSITDVTVFNGHTYAQQKVPAGLVVAGTIRGFPAYGNITPGSILYKLNGEYVYNSTQLSNILNNIRPDTSIKVITLNYNSNLSSPVEKNFTLITGSKYSYYSQYDPTANSYSYKNQSFIGVEISYLGISLIPINDIRSEVLGTSMLTSPWYGTLGTIALPFSGLSPIPGKLASLFSTPFNPFIFWGLFNMLFWLFWMDFLLGLTNALPFFILDGGQFFKDTLKITSRRRIFAKLGEEKTIANIALLMNFIVFFLIIWEIVALEIA